MTSPFILALSARMAALCLPVSGARYDLPQPLAWRLTGHNVTDGMAEKAVLVLNDLRPATAYRFEAEGVGAISFTTPALSGLVKAADFGLRSGTDIADEEAALANARALAEAVAAVPPDGMLVLPPGRHVSLPLRLKSHMTLHFEEGAVLQAPASRQHWPILPARDDTGRMLGSWEGLPADCYAAPLHAVDAEALTIEGPGIVDGGGDRSDWWTWPKETRNGARRPRGLHLIRCRDVQLIGFTIRNAPSWTIHPQGCEQVAAVGLSIQAPHDSPNTDGFDPEGCRDVTLAGLHFTVGDDCIAIKAGKRGPRGEADHLAETRRIHIHHCLMERGHGGVVIGSEMSGGVHDVLVEDCDMIGTDRGLRLKTRRGRGGRISNIRLRRVRLDGVQTAFSANAHYFCDADGHAPWVQSRDSAAVNETTPVIEGIAVEDVAIHGLAHAVGVFLGLPEAPIQSVTLSRVAVHSHDENAIATPPIMADHIRPMRHEGVLAEHAVISCDDPALLSAGVISLVASETSP
ncbi:polygalacturonase PglA [Rhizobium paknamense]|uniref:Polygalacturonase n=1 Tax=Rhizobium paknamense TaxID=1206817 RepID=A0ABU0ICB1_9HYPH|nr:glycoside hydrolase family 28 protein [Rhizobium paknamense]MDQ0455879.1 polygalacturonase [Rhizobium paknamense]